MSNERFKNMREVNDYLEKQIQNEQLIFDFCKWLGSQGCLYEVLYYGDHDEIKEVIDKYLAEKESDNE